jgi:Protein of unknown function (DUF1573)
MFDKKAILLVLFSGIVWLISAQNSGKPIIKFDVDTADFGVVQEGDTIRYDFRFSNIGDADLLIKQAWPACGCTHPTYPKEAIKPGESGVIHVEFISEGWGGQTVLKEVIIISNAPENYARFRAKITKRSAVKREEDPPQESSKSKKKSKKKKWFSNKQ